jgi:hypothetical protein
MDRVSPLVGLLIAMASMATVAAERSLCADLPLSERGCIVHSHLAVNDSNETRHVVVASEHAGVDQLRQLARESALEESWAFLPSAGLWVETGLHEVSTPQVAEVEVDVAYLAQLAGRFQRVHLYHFHPSAPAGGEAISVATRVADIASVDRDIAPVALPGFADIVASFEITWALEQARADVQIGYFVISEFGTVAYGPTPIGLRTVGAARYDPRAAGHHAFAMGIAVRMGPYNLTRMLDGRAYTIGDLIDELCAQISDAEYRMSYSAPRRSWSLPGPAL